MQAGVARVARVARMEGEAERGEEDEAKCAVWAVGKGVFSGVGPALGDGGGEWRGRGGRFGGREGTRTSTTGLMERRFGGQKWVAVGRDIGLCYMCMLTDLTWLSRIAIPLSLWLAGLELVGF